MNVVIEAEYEALARETLKRLRDGGPEFRKALVALMNSNELPDNSKKTVGQSD